MIDEDNSRRALRWIYEHGMRPSSQRPDWVSEAINDAFEGHRLALAAGSRRAETNEDLAQCEASQSGAAKTAQRPTSGASSDKERE